MFCLEFKPLYQERVWGGQNFATKLNRDLPENTVIGESWEIVDRPEAQSVVTEGPLAGQSLRQLLESHAKEIMGPEYDASRPFPILVKWLDCQDRLSLQVHPPQEKAEALQGEPKTEVWYIADCTEDAALLAGLVQGSTEEEFAKALKNNNISSFVHSLPVQAGDSLFVPSGRLHAIDAGNLILEVQQNSDTTYRVYDWGRVGLDGQPRQLHIEESLSSIDFNDFEPELHKHDDLLESTLATCEHFRLRKFQLLPFQGNVFFAPGQPRLCHVISGQVIVTNQNNEEHTLNAGSNCLITAQSQWTLKAISESTILITDQFV